jgi:F0F1-type ATP synthase assembly protein I
MANCVGRYEWRFFFVRNGTPQALAGFGGGLVAAFLSLLVALRFFAVKPQSGAEQMLKALFRAEAVKWVWVLLLFGAAARLVPEYFAMLIIGFLVSSIVNWFALLWYPNGVPRAG